MRGINIWPYPAICVTRRFSYCPLSVCGAPGKLGFLVPTVLDDLCRQLRGVEKESEMVQIRIVVRERWSVSDLWPRICTGVGRRRNEFQKKGFPQVQM